MPMPKKERALMRLLRLVIGGMVIAMASWVHATVPTKQEMADRARWVRERFEGKVDAPAPETGLIVEANNDPVQRNARGGRPLNIAGKQFTRGLYCHAVSRVRVVNLPAGAKTFSALVGVDSNEQTSGGRGSVVFRVSAAGKELFKSGVVREGTAAAPVAVELNGATELLLEVDDGGDGISCDQSDWADAKVTMADGETIWLGELPILKGGWTRTGSTDPVFSFVYGGEPFRPSAGAWKIERTSEKLDEQRTRRTILWREKFGLVVRCEGVEYQDFPTVEWTVYLKNEGTSDTPIISDLRGMDLLMDREPGGEVVLHHNAGALAIATDYQLLTDTLTAGARKHITTSGGRPSNSDWPYFNLACDGGGAIVAIGWPGQWAADFDRDKSGELRVRAGQELTHFKLHPGEEVRTPLIVMQFYHGDVQRSQNVWRKWMIGHNMPHIGGEPPAPMCAACSSHQYAEMINADEASQILFIDRYLEEKIKLDFWWMDAGWYVNKGGWPNTGTWEVDTKRFPRGLRAITDHGHEKGVKSIVWFEPERVNPGTWLYEKHPEWLLGKDGGDKLLNLGNPEARRWLIEHMDGLIKSQGIDLYRSDYNIDPLPYWRGADTEDRQGMTEIQYARGFLAYWDELRRRHPNMLIDTCASGGRRNDIETLRRAVPLLRSDYIVEPIGQQLHTYGLASWVPYFGTGINSFDPYTFRSQMTPFLIMAYDLRKRDSDYNALRKMFGEWKEMRDFWMGDYYPLTPYASGNDAWMAWQFDRPEKGAGVVQVFRRGESIYESARLKLKGLDPAATYQVRDIDSDKAQDLTGQELSDVGLLVGMPKQPAARIITYRRR
jgi:alpha-galactosidase